MSLYIYYYLYIVLILYILLYVFSYFIYNIVFIYIVVFIYNTRKKRNIYILYNLIYITTIYKKVITMSDVRTEIKEKTKSSGRPRKDVQWDVVDELAMYHCTPAEIVAFLSNHYEPISYDVLNDRTKEIYNVSFGNYITLKHEALAKPKLRKKMWENAMSGNSTMQIWLSKQYLGMSDKQEIENYNLEVPVIVDDLDEEE